MLAQFGVVEGSKEYLLATTILTGLALKLILLKLQIENFHGEQVPLKDNFPIFYFGHCDIFYFGISRTFLVGEAEFISFEKNVLNVQIDILSARRKRLKPPSNKTRIKTLKLQNVH